MLILKENLNPRFIKKSIKMFGANRLDYSLVNYIDQYTKVTLTCKKHNLKFEQVPKFHFKTKHAGCPACFSEYTSIYNSKSSVVFFKQAKNLHNDTVDYSKTVFIDSNTLSVFICKIHNIEYKQKPKYHTLKKGNGGCPTCRAIKVGGANKKSNEEFIQDSIRLYKNRFYYYLTIYIGSDKEVIIVCRNHGPFTIIAGEHLRHCGGCTKCKNSEGEDRVLEELEKYKNIFKLSEIEKDKAFDDCINPRTNRKLKFDFKFKVNKNICLIEYDGGQHFKSVVWYGGDTGFEGIKYRDNIKNQYAIDNDIPMLRIPYTEFKNINLLVKCFLEKTLNSSA